MGWFSEDSSSSGEAGPILEALLYELDREPDGSEPDQSVKEENRETAELPAQLYPLVSAAVRERFHSWPGLICLEIGRIRQSEDDPVLSYRFDPAQLELGRPCIACSRPEDWVDFYAAYPEATGFLGVWLQPGETEVMMAHVTGGGDDFLSWDGHEAVRPDGPLARPFDECLAMEQTASGWKVRARREGYRDETPALREYKARELLAAELGVEVLSLKVDRSNELVACRLRWEGRLYEFAVGREVEARLYYDPLIVVGSAPITARNILDGIRLYCQHEAS